MGKGLFIRLPQDLEERFTAICGREGFKKGGLITKWVRDFVRVHGEKDPIREAAEYGIDLSLLRTNLRKSPTERLRDHAAAHIFVEKLRLAGEEKNDAV
jgi:hypothetical protein